MTLHLRDTNPFVVEAWRTSFQGLCGVTIEVGNILEEAENALVSPANSHGFMDGGIDRAYRDFFGAGLESRVREWIQRRPEGRLPIGEAIVVPTDHSRIPYLIVAPTMTMPECVDANACYRATKAALRTAAKHPERIAHVFCPGMATGVGGIPPKDAAEAMAEAWRSMDTHGFSQST